MPLHCSSPWGAVFISSRICSFLILGLALFLLCLCQQQHSKHSCQQQLPYFLTIQSLKLPLERAQVDVIHNMRTPAGTSMMNSSL